MRKILLSGFFALCVGAAQAEWKPGEGVANDHARGGNAHDITFVARDANNGYGYRQYVLPIGLTFLPWSAPNFESSVYGLRLNFGWGRYNETYGIDGGVASCGKTFGGIQATFIVNDYTEEASGIQMAAVNKVDGDVYGLQIGAVNIAGDLHGVQIGFLNFNSSGIVLPLINIGF